MRWVGKNVNFCELVLRFGNAGDVYSTRRIFFSRGMNDATDFPIPENALVEVHPGPGSQAPEGLARVYRQDLDNLIIAELRVCLGENGSGKREG